jgi:hypothetical protein
MQGCQQGQIARRVDVGDSVQSGKHHRLRIELS